MNGVRQNLVVVGVDGSGSAQHAVRWAAAEAGRRGATIRLVHAFMVPTSGYPGFLAQVHEVREGMRWQGEQWLEEAAATVAGVAPEILVEKLLVEAGAVPTMRLQSREACLVVLGSRGLGAFTGMLVGSTAVALAAHGHSPIAVVRGPGLDDVPPQDGAVVVGVDGSPAGNASIGRAFEEASQREADLVAVHAWNDRPMENTAYAYRVTMDPDVIDNDAKRVLTEQLAPWREKYPDVRVDQMVERGRPAKVLLEHATRAQLVVVGSRGQEGWAGLLLGSTSRALITHAPCPVLVVGPDSGRTESD